MFPSVPSLLIALFSAGDSSHIPVMAKTPDSPKKSGKTPKPKAPNSKAARPEVQPIGPALAELLNPAINRGESGLGSSTGLQPPPDNSWDRRSGGEAAAHRARASTRGKSDDVAKRDASLTGDEASSSSPPPAREARGGIETSEARSVGSEVGGGATDTPPVGYPPPRPSPIRGDGEEKQAGSALSRDATHNRAGFDEASRANYGTAATIPMLDP